MRSKVSRRVDGQILGDRESGFIGSALARELLQRGEQVLVLDNFLTGYRRNLAEVSNRIELLEADSRWPGSFLTMNLNILLKKGWREPLHGIELTGTSFPTPSTEARPSLLAAV